MEPTLIYDAATMSRLPQEMSIVAGLLVAIAIALRVLKRDRGLLLWFAGAAAFMSLLAVAAQVEKQMMASSTEIRQVEGPVVHPSEWRTRRAGTHNEYTRWQGFWIGEVGFSYPLNVGANTFSNAAPHHVDLHDGLLLRVHYIEDREAGVVQRHIVRVERLPQ